MKSKIVTGAAVLSAAGLISLAFEIVRPFDEVPPEPQVIATVHLTDHFLTCCSEHQFLSEPWWSQDLSKPYYLEPGSPPLND